MKKISFYSLLIGFILYSNLSFGQDENESTYSKFSLITYGTIGFAKVENDNQANYNLDANSAELLLNYKFNKKYGIFTGVGITELSGSGFNDESIFYHERSVIKIPLGLSISYDLSDKLSTYMGIAAYGQTIISDEYRYIDRTVEDLYEGWNFGAQFSLGITHQVDDCLSIGLIYSGQSDFTKLETTDNASFKDEQKITDLNTLGLLLEWTF
ncbi:hypothetical protein [Winogradskyella forsetii]|uniref:hypothetical protein n=1 Tax=Winogradskyella forsetii TaxID=2686077 RepID=UPI0015BEF112|nr:hypothetical protein [Winogradskyella forsetii]